MLDGENFLCGLNVFLSWVAMMDWKVDMMIGMRIFLHLKHFDYNSQKNQDIISDIKGSSR